jgi:hypothetical protein
MNGKTEYKFQISFKNKEDILVVRGDTIDELQKAIKEAKEVLYSTEKSSEPSKGTTYICNTCGLEAKLITGTNSRGNYRGIVCSSDNRDHTQWLNDN